MLASLKQRYRLIRRKRAGLRIVAAAAAELDRDLPLWANFITRPVNLSSTEDCILAQIYGSFDNALAQRFVKHLLVYHIDAFSPHYDDPTWPAIQAAWQEAVNHRRKRRVA